MSTLMRRNGDVLPDLGSFFDDFFTGDLWDRSMTNYSGIGMTMPKVNVKETENEYQLAVAVPGMKKEDFNIELENNQLTISSEKEHEDEEKSGDYTRREFSYQSFRRTFALPENIVDGDKIKAEYKDGILNITVPKKEEAKAKAAKRIEIA